MNAACSVWGGVSSAGMKLALPLAALREVLPGRDLQPLPCAAPAVVGGLPVRGVTVPVLDLALHLGRPAPAAPGECVVLLAHDGRLLGLRADGVDGVFEADGPPVTAAAPAQDFGGSLRREQDGALFSLLSVEALARHASLPWIHDPEPHRQDGHDDLAAAPEGESIALMLVRSARLHLAIDALLVHATLWQPQVQASVLRGGACVGTVRHGAREIAALDLAALLGFSRLAAGAPVQALVLRTDAGEVALLVERVDDIVRVPREQVVALPGFALPAQVPLAGVCAREVLERSGTGLSSGIAADHLVLDAAGLMALPLLQELARTNVPVAGAAADDPAAGGPGGAAPAGMPVITVRLPTETAIPMAQVSEILAFGEEDAVFGPEQLLRRVQMRRGRAVPVYCLARLTGGSAEGADETAAVLMVELADTWIGFAVPVLRSMERASRVDTLPPHALGQADGPGQVVSLGQGADTRSVRLVDLHALAARLMARAQRPA